MVDDMDKSQFFYELPKESIAQHPAEPRDSSRLMCLSRTTGEVEEHVFRDILDLLQPGDVLVVNDSRVIPARLLGIKQGGGAKCEVLMPCETRQAPASRLQDRLFGWRACGRG